MRLTNRTPRARALTLSIRGATQRFSHYLMIGAAAFLVVIAQAQPQIASRARMAIVDVLGPFLQIVTSPVASIQSFGEIFHDYSKLDTELTQLRHDNMTLTQWRDTALKLQAENASLKQLLTYKPEPNAPALAARILAEPDASLTHSLLILAGTNDGVRQNSIAVTDQGVLGRLTEIGLHTSRILLPTDVNSRIPVWIEKSHDRAVLAGSADGKPTLQFLSPDADVVTGDRIVTSGHGGIFPAGIPVGVVTDTKNNQIRVSLFVNIAHTDYVRIMDYSSLVIPPDVQDDETDQGTETKLSQAPHKISSRPSHRHPDADIGYTDPQGNHSR